MIQNILVSIDQYKLHSPFVTAVRRVEAIETITVHIETESGLKGVGAASPTWQITGDSIASIKEAILQPIKSELLGQPLSSLEALLTKVKTACKGNYSAKAAVDIALYDLFSKRRNLPLYEMLGGYRNCISTDMTLSIDQEEKMTMKAMELIKDGYDALKIKIGGKFEEDLSRIRSLRQAVGSEITLRIDANQHWEPKEAVRFIQKLEEENLKIEFIEQPVAADDFEGLAYVTQHVTTPIMADESLFSAKDALKLVNMQACDLFNIKLMKTGGIREAIVIADIAEAAGISCMIGSMMESPISVAAAIHLACGHRNITKADMDAPLWLENKEAIKGVSYNKSLINCLNSPGIGIEASMLK
ncbi:dipeptide epimerase [Bacillus aquiflavi]|uniref:Dipeptide epimerase n=1 Tax=Bacillus aquiflavi TaxID=2672567 RepID=A0A6B3VYS5_9BACI|nr:dipeptide epimerase [Bacillus aquiflavi]MBA4536368.1 dipeptide epimerase [Bacillus aquiflavi]NEY80736.1 dipeptide epimerase [Bacillus aquiflavi]